MSEEKKNLKGRKGDLFYYRWVKTGKKKPVKRMKRGKEEVYFQEILEKVYFKEKEVKSFSLEKYGQPLPRTHGNVTILDNYFLDYWGHFLGTGGTTAFSHLLRFCYGDKEYCYPELGLIEAKMNVSRPTLRGYLDKLEEHGFLVRFWVQNPSKKNLDESAIYKIRRTIPFLSQELIEQLPPVLRADHDKYVSRLTESYEISLNDRDDYDEVLGELNSKGEVKATPKQLTIFDQQQEETLSRSILLKQQKDTDRELWNQALSYLQTLVSKPSFDTWFKDTFMVSEEGRIVVYADTEFVSDWLESRYKELVNEALSYIGVATTMIEFKAITHT